jgi:hypothetical protein
MGVVKQAVNRSAGRSGFMGRICVSPHAASWMQPLKFGAGQVDNAGDFASISCTVIKIKVS